MPSSMRSLSARLAITNAAREASETIAELDAEIAELAEAVRGLLAHAGIADAAPEDVDEEDHRAERIARLCLERRRQGT